MKKSILVLSVAFAITLWISCKPVETCGDAERVARENVEKVCNGRPTSPFCKECVINKYHSYRVETGQCVCRHLVYDTASCWYPNESEAESAAGNAIEQADRACDAFILPVEIELQPKDAGVQADTAPQPQPVPVIDGGADSGG